MGHVAIQYSVTYDDFKLVCIVVCFFFFLLLFFFFFFRFVFIVFWVCDFWFPWPLCCLPSTPPAPAGLGRCRCRPLQQSPAAGCLLRARGRVFPWARRTPRAPTAWSPRPEPTARALSGQAQRDSLFLGVPFYRGSRLPGPPRASGRSVRAR